MHILLLFTLISSLLAGSVNKKEILLIEAESFQEKGGWLVDPQFVELMGSPYLLAHGLGRPVKDAKTRFTIYKKGDYHIWVRTKDWAPGRWESPGRFQLIVDGQRLFQIMGTQQDWNWQYAGKKNLKKGEHLMTLNDLTGFDGRCDAICLSTDETAPPSDPERLAEWRQKVLQAPEAPQQTGQFDLVITGGGIAGCAAAIAAAEQGLQVALIHDRPVLGGNASGEIRVHTLGIYGHFERILKMIDTEHYPNGSPEAIGEDEKRLTNIKKYSNIHLFLNWRAYNAHAENDIIQYVDASHTSTGEQMRFEAPLFVDCTGDGWIGFWSGAEYRYGRESEDTFGESWDKYGELWSPDEADNFVMGASLLWRSREADTVSHFPEVPWAREVAGDYAAANGEWQWEYSSNDLHQIDDAEKIRDHMLKAIYGSFYNEKQKSGNEKLALEWVSYLVGKRESRRLVGDHVYNFNDVRNHIKFPDSVVVEEREVDVHYQQNLMDSSMPDFISEALYFRAGRYYVPYRSLYSKNILNLFWDLAGHFTRFDTLQGKPLTKYDHLPFTGQDYLKLQMTLSNENSILGEKNLDELFDKNQSRYSEKIDAVTGATAREIQSAVVEGALYSTYTLWHLVNDEINQSMRKYTLSNYSTEIESQLLDASNPRTLIFGLSNLDDWYFYNHFERIIEIMKSEHPLVNFYIAKKMPPPLLDIDENRDSLIKIWDILDRNTQSVLSAILQP